MSTNMEQIKQLREKTGVGIGKCKEALQQAEGDLNAAIDYLRKQGMASAVKRQGRETHEGAIAVGETEEAVVLIEVNAETDFVAQNERFLNFLTTLANQAACKLPHTLQELLEQPYEGDATLSVDQFRATLVQSLGENIQVRRFDAFAKGATHSIGVYVHSGAKIVALVQINGSREERDLAREIAMHVAASSPDFLSPETVPEEVLEKEREIARSQMQGKPTQILEGILAGKVRAFCQTSCLTEQEYIKEPNVKIKEVVERRAKELGKSLQLAHFVRWSVAD